MRNEYGGGERVMLVAMKCPICGGEVKLNSDMKMGECEYCGSPVVIPQNMEKNRINNFNNCLFMEYCF